MFSLMSTLGVKALRSLTWVTRRAARSAPEITATLRPTSRVSCARFWAVMVMASSSVTGSAARASPAPAIIRAAAPTPATSRARPDC